MKLKNDVEAANTRRKLSKLQELIRRKQNASTGSPAREMALESMTQMERKLQTEIAEYERAHQTA